MTCDRCEEIAEERDYLKGQLDTEKMIKHRLATDCERFRNRIQGLINAIVVLGLRAGDKQ